MPSILFINQAEIFDAIRNKGWSYTQVASSLADKNVQISRQSVHCWYTRLCKKIAARKGIPAYVCEDKAKGLAEKSNNSKVSTNSNELSVEYFPRPAAESIKRAIDQFETKKPTTFFSRFKHKVVRE